MMDRKMSIPEKGTWYYSLVPDFSGKTVAYKPVRYLWYGSRLDKLRFVNYFFLSIEDAKEEAIRVNNLLERI